MAAEDATRKCVTVGTWTPCLSYCNTKSAFLRCVRTNADLMCQDALSQERFVDMIIGLHATQCIPETDQTEASELLSTPVSLIRASDNRPRMIPITYKIQFDFFASDNRMVITDKVTGMNVFDYRGAFDWDSEGIKTGTLQLVQGRPYEFEVFESTGDGVCWFTCGDKGWCNDKCVSVEISSENGVLTSFQGGPGWGDELGAEAVYKASFQANDGGIGDFQARIER